MAATRSLSCKCFALKQFNVFKAFKFFIFGLDPNTLKLSIIMNGETSWYEISRVSIRFKPERATSPMASSKSP
ncbi:hypothetical protein COLO4_33999 [Corchorus olitorius]|uniref:Uncharacterized protein n=1 Tax=Corchorus olitorius TaxID=93759 RepID=A0A1R3GPD3_9ROSI|nr:hypothetical protein COLO4_33999 [Corchorus olitorius]